MRATTCCFGAVVVFAILYGLSGPAKGQERKPATQPTVQMWDITSDRDARVLQLPACDIAFTGDGKRLAVAGKSVLQLELATGRELWRTDIGPFSFGRRLAFSPDGKRLAVSHSTGVAILDAGTGRIVLSLVREYLEKKISKFQGMTPVAFSPDGKMVASTTIMESRGEIDLWDANTGQLARTLSVPNEKGIHNVFDVAFSPDGRSIAAVGGGFSQDAPRREGGEVRVWDLTTGTVVRTFAGAVFCCWTAAFSPDGKLLAIGGGLYGNRPRAGPVGEVRVWDVETGGVVYAADRRDCIFKVIFSPDGSRLISGGGRWKGACDPELTLTDTSAWRELLTFKGHRTAIEGIASSRDGGTLASSSYAGTIRIWNLPPGGAGTSPATTQAATQPATRPLSQSALQPSSGSGFMPGEGKSPP